MNGRFPVNWYGQKTDPDENYVAVLYSFDPFDSSTFKGAAKARPPHWDKPI